MKTATIDELNTTQTAAIQNSNISLDEREDQGTIRKTQLFKPAYHSASSKTLAGRVTEGPIQQPSLDLLQQILLEQPSYLETLRNSVAAILTQLSRIAEKDRTQIDEMKKKYENSYKLSAGLTKEIAWNGFKYSAFALVPLILYKSPHKFDNEMGGKFANEFIPTIGKMWNSTLESDMKRADSLSGLLIQEYSAKTSKSSSESNSKQEIIGLLDKAVSALKEAARAG